MRPFHPVCWDKALSESRSTMGPKPRPILGLFTPRREIRVEIKSGSIVLKSSRGEVRSRMLTFSDFLSLYSHTSTHT